MQIALGAMAPKLTEQLDGLIDEGELLVLDKDAEAITRLYIRGYIPQSTAEKARKKLIKEIGKKLEV